MPVTGAGKVEGGRDGGHGGDGGVAWTPFFFEFLFEGFEEFFGA